MSRSQNKWGQSPERLEIVRKDQNSRAKLTAISDGVEAGAGSSSRTKEAAKKIKAASEVPNDGRPRVKKATPPKPYKPAPRQSSPPRAYRPSGRN